MTHFTPPMVLDHAAIERLIPHAGPMCLLDRMVSCSEAGIECIAVNHRDATHPLRTAGGLMATATIEYAAQAAALHGAVAALAANQAAVPGALASARGVQLDVLRLDDLPRADPDELRVSATRQAGDAARLLYAFMVEHGGRRIAAGRLAVVLGLPGAEEGR